MYPTLSTPGVDRVGRWRLNGYKNAGANEPENISTEESISASFSQGDQSVHGDRFLVLRFPFVSTPSFGL